MYVVKHNKSNFALCSPDVFFLSVICVEPRIHLTFLMSSSRFLSLAEITWAKYEELVFGVS
jgi:hypothetical protein